MQNIPLDLKTILLIYTLIKVAQAVAMLHVWNTHRHYPPVRDWLMGSSFVAIGILLITARDTSPVWLSVITANAFIIPGWIIFDFGFIRAAGRSVPWRSAFLVSSAAILSITWYAIVTPDYSARLITFTISVLIFDGYTVYSCIKSKDQGKAATLRISGSLIFLTMISNIWRTASCSNLSFSSIFSPTLAQAQFYIVIICFSLLITTMVILLASQKLQDEINDMSKHLLLKREKERDDARIRAMTDGLTRLANRRHFDEALHTEFYRLKRSGAPLSLIMIDIDHFKKFNDSYGHIAGDNCLKQVALGIKNITGRAHDIVARYGGEEFAVILPETDDQRATALAERIRKAVEQLEIPHELSESEKYVTVSLGVVTVSASVIASPETVVDMADKALYRAKKNGRNRVESAEDDVMLYCNTDVTEPGLVKLVWHQSNECGSLIIDEQHKGLFESSNQLLSAVICGSSKEECTALLEKLLAEIVTHFHDEEEIFKNTGFPGAEEHCQLHKDLVLTASSLAEKYKNNILPPGELFSFLAYDVVAHHLFIEDRKFFPYL